MSLDHLVEPSVRLGREWLNHTDDSANNSATEQLSGLLREPGGVAFTMDFVDRVARPEDNGVAAAELRKMPTPPAFLGSLNRGMMGLGSLASHVAPGVVMPLARKRLKHMVSHLVLNSEGPALNALLEDAASKGQQLNLNPLGEAVLGDGEASRRSEQTMEIINNPRVTYVSVKASSLCAQLNHYDEEGSLERLKEALRPLYRAGRDSDPVTFVNLDMEEYKDLDLTLRLFTELMSEDEFLGYHAGIVLQAYLPDSVAAMHKLIDFAHERKRRGGAPIKVRIVKGANLSMERVDAEVHGWAQAPYATKAEVDANYLRLLDLVLTEENADVLRVGVASHNTFTLACAYQIAQERGVLRQVDAEMLQGMSPGQAKVVHEAFGSLILYTPVVRDEDFDVAVSYLVRRLEENAAEENFLHALFAPGDAAITDQEARFRQAIREAAAVSAEPRRQQNRLEETGRQAPRTSFRNEPDTDPSLEPNRQWAIEALQRDPGAVESPEISDPAQVKSAIDSARAAGRAWAQLSGDIRAEVLETIADELADARGDLVSVMAQEAGKTVDQSDPEVSEAIDFAVYYAARARELDERFTPHELVSVVPPWNFPVAIPVGGMTAALAAGSAVVIKPAPQVVRCAEVAVAAIHRGLRKHGIDESVLQLINADESEAGKAVVTGADSVILTGASDTAALFRSWDPELKINAETSGKNAIIVTPAADPDLAVADVIASAFGHAGQKCSAASLVILVGSMGTSKRFLTQLVDAAKTLKVGYGTDLSTRMNGLIEAPGEKLRRGLTQLDEGESWLLEPRQLDEEGLLFSPGIRTGVKPGSWYHCNECFGPVLGLMHARDLDEAIEWQNSTGFGLTGGIHSLDDDALAHWIDKVEVGNAYVNRGITGAIVQRQSFGGWKNSVIGQGAKAGGPNYVAQLGTWSDGELQPINVSLRPDIERFLRKAESELDAADALWLRRAAERDAQAWDQEFGREHDRTALASERNIFRYRPLLGALHVRLGQGWSQRDLLRLRMGAMLTGCELEVTSALDIPGVTTLSDEEFSRTLSQTPGQRVRTLGSVADEVYRAAAESGSVILDSPVLADGRRELLHQLLEQAVSVTSHRFGVLRTVAHLD
ncbi:proline dehydrogenase family protein [Corynebacterium tapiri]|uniref:L-glutamate gamma-semialdehyde dehydrogenase n=1 Tax=Corynebacterium tapiri TaxID=1448266 RepID=A0A5C4U7I1_9CORY|nr:bifunctional proline dehydrogenase/L-glutamate gamma-semialdehyde dehydrogenase [Corynebacterium tapiri]TNM00528.1 aldehyde dehydrogenase family protein [Corynebacterium tapiri]